MSYIKTLVQLPYICIENEGGRDLAGWELGGLGVRKLSFIVVEVISTSNGIGVRDY